MLQGGEYEGRKKNLIDDENLRLFLLDEADTILDDEATRRWLFTTRRESSDAGYRRRFLSLERLKLSFTSRCILTAPLSLMVQRVILKLGLTYY
ncbi:unnamed protein product [Brassica oleracea]